ncbi:hypothetical protein VTI74DRAFT_8547 [Chaetomium olivicolor]
MQLAAVTAFQRWGHEQLPGLVPAMSAVGITETSDGRLLEYSVTEYCNGTTTLDEVWDTLDPNNQVNCFKRHIVFCHKYLEPRNILVGKTSPYAGHTTRYELAAIIDWDLGGLYPFAYEFGLKDCCLGTAN